LQALGDSTGEDLLSEVMRAFLQQGERDLVAMRRALEAGDAPALAAAAHG
ncbi:MAG TPA: histidine kinase, partial [Acidobacteria bacterium]|nr:histidine kinase [Acidobacteriota bacterium]